MTDTPVKFCDNCEACECDPCNCGEKGVEPARKYGCGCRCNPCNCDPCDCGCKCDPCNCDPCNCGCRCNPCNCDPCDCGCNCNPEDCRGANTEPSLLAKYIYNYGSYVVLIVAGVAGGYYGLKYFRRI